jgi:hypothetical protein
MGDDLEAFGQAGWLAEDDDSCSSALHLISIKSVRSLNTGSCVALDNGYCGIEFPQPAHETFGAGLEVLELPGACIEEVEFAIFLSGLSRLRSLKISCHSKYDCGFEMDTAAIVGAIGEQVGETLETFSFSTGTTFSIEQLRLLPAMDKFIKLKDFELETEIFLVLEDYDELQLSLPDTLPRILKWLHIIVQNLDSVPTNRPPLLSNISLRKRMTDYRT